MVCSTIFIITAIVAMQCSGNDTNFTLMMIIGFCFSWAGDFFLHVKPGSEMFFSFGLTSFLIAHIFYVAAYSTATNVYFPGTPFMNLYEVIALIVVTSVGFASVMARRARPGKAFLPVMLYMDVLVTMVIKAVTFAIRIFTSGATAQPIMVGICLILGSVLFFISDYTLSILTFVKGVEKHGLRRKVNIYTYFFAQLFLALTILYIIPIG